MRNKEETLGKLIDNCKVAYLSYIDENGFPITKAMLKPRKRVGIKEFYFTTNTSSNKVKDYLKNNQASVYFVDHRFIRGVSLLGTVEVLTDKENKEMIWIEGDEKYYSLGVTDPDYCVLKLTAVKGRYYHSFKNEDFSV